MAAKKKSTKSAVKPWTPPRRKKRTTVGKLSDLSFAIVDVDVGLPLSERQQVAAAIQRQVREHFAPIWGMGANASVRAATPDAPPLAGEIQCQLLKVPTQAGALAFHDRMPDGTPITYTFPVLCETFGDAWSSALSHEVLELLGDPYLHLCVELDDGSVWDRENCDRVEGDTYEIDGVAVTNFNTPECFEPPQVTDGVKYDYLSLSTAPNQVRPNGGYSQEYKPGKGWVQHGAMRPYRKALAKMGISRGARRRARRQSLLTRVVSFFRRLIGR